MGGTSRYLSLRRVFVKNVTSRFHRKSQDYVYGKVLSLKHDIVVILEIKNNAWVTVNNDFGVMSEAICPWFCHEWKSLANRVTSDPKVVIHGNECIILFLARYFISWTPNSATINYPSLISALSLRTVFSDLVLWRHHSWFVTSRERRVLALWHHIRRLFLHA